MSDLKKIKKAVITAAGYGTRFLPATKNQPKEMLPIVDKPSIQYLVEELVDSGIEDIIICTRVGMSALENHFDSSFELEYTLEQDGKTELLEQVRKIPQMANIVYTRQKKHMPYGNGVPLLTAFDFLEPGERFIYMFGDDMVLADTPCTKQIMDYSDKRDGCPVVAVQEIAHEEVKRYGIYKLAEGSEDRVLDAVEKPKPEDAPSNLAQFGRFVLNYDIAQILYNQYKANKLGKDNELWLIDAIIEYAHQNPVYAARIQGEWMTTGDPLRYMQTQVRFALERPDLGKQFAQFLKNLPLEKYTS